MSSNPEHEMLSLPDGMVTSIFTLRELGMMMAEHADIAPGKYDVVIEYKFGAVNMQPEPNVTHPAMAIGFGGLGLRQAKSDGILTIDYTGKAKKRSPKKAGE